ncbi:MAG: alpha/beta hydrolase [Pseudomonadota bacterium]
MKNIEVNGNSVAYATGTGHPAADAPVILFVHGAGMDHSVWVMPARFFARHGYRVIAPDLPGHGLSAPPAIDSVADYADWIAALLDALAIDRCVLVGHSMGSLIAYATAASHPQRIDKVALLGTSAPMPVSDALLGAAADDHPAAFAMGNTWSHSPTGRLGRGGTPGTWNLMSGLRLLERSAPGVYHADLAACNGFDQAAFPAVESTTPALVIAGAKDQMTPPKAGIKVAAGLPNCTQVTLPDCGHSMLSEAPNAVLDALAAFAGVAT